MNGPVTIVRKRYRSRQQGETVYPLDAVLDLPRSEVTPGLARRALHLGTQMSFVALQVELFEQHGVRVSDSTLDRLMQTVGGVANRDRREQVAQLAALPPGVAREELLRVEEVEEVPQRLYISCDGVMYPTRYREVDSVHCDRRRIQYQEMKTGTVFWQDRQEHWHKRVIYGRESSEQFGLALWRLAGRCGMLVAREVIFISDGGVWCDTVYKKYFRDATRILDWYHLSEHVWDAGRELHPHDDAAVRRWVATCLNILESSSGRGLLRHLQTQRAAIENESDAAAKPLDALIGYLEPRVAITDYVAYRAAGYIIGSGMQESTCKQLVSGRLKGSGRQWSESGALAMTALIAHRLNGSWNRFWATRPQQRAA